MHVDAERLSLGASRSGQGRPPPVSRRRGRGATGRGRAAAVRASRRWSSRRRCARGRRAGTSDRSRSRRRRAAARPACRRRAPRTPRDGRRARRRTARRRNAPCAGPASSRRARAAARRSAPSPRQNPCPARPSAPNRCRARRRAHRRTRPESSAKRRQAARRWRRRRALMRHWRRKWSPVSSGSGRPSSPADTASTPCGASSSRISASLPGLWVAITSSPAIARDAGLSRHRLIARSRARSRAPPSSAGRPACRCPLRASASRASNCSSVNGVFLGGALHLDDAAVAGHDEIGVGIGCRILGVIEIEHRQCRRRCRRRSRRRGRAAGCACNMSRVFIQAMQSCSATQAPVIDAVRVPPSAWITSQSMVICRSPSASRSTTARRLRPIRRWISSVRPPCLPAAPRGGCARRWRAAACRIRR